MNVITVASIVTLIVLSIYDICTKTIPVAGVVVLGFMSLVRFALICLSTNMSIGLTIIPLIPGAISLITSYIASRKSSESIGVGDGIVLIFMGLGRTYVYVVVVLFVALLVVSAYACSGLIRKEVHSSIQIPFVPFITIGVLVAEYL